MANSFIAGIRNVVPFLKTEPRLPHRTVLSVCPVRHPSITWERTGADDLVVIKIPKPKEGWFRALIAKWFVLPDFKTIEMADELSSMVWELCDGEHSVGQITDRIAREYKLSNRQAEVGVLALLRTLQGKRLIGVPKQSFDDAMAAEKPPERSRNTGPGFYSSKRRTKSAR